MASARDAEAPSRWTRDSGTRLVLVGDIKQLGSVGAGRAFAKLREAGTKKFALDQIVR